MLQHWSSEAVAAFPPRLRQFKYAVLANDLKILREGRRSLRPGST